MVTNLMAGGKPGRGRPRAFDPEAALAVGQRLFHAGSYDAVGLSALTGALGIKPPSFYMAFGSKGAFFERVLERYTRTVMPLADILRPDSAVSDALADLLERAARTYAQDPECTGCLALEAARGHPESEGVVLARRATEGRRKQLRDFIARDYPDSADVVTDFISIIMSGLSASAREGMDETRLLAVSHAATHTIRTLLR